MDIKEGLLLWFFDKYSAGSGVNMFANSKIKQNQRP